MVSAYSTPRRRRPNTASRFFITRITDKNGTRARHEFTNETQHVMSDKTVGHLINMLRDAVDQGTGQAVRAQFGLRADVAGKPAPRRKIPTAGLS